ncbi:hypothetical protein [Actinoplanes sp. L3-i22]|uniref:hypothetical protein n=1 Tax=Actinoplanes sp. L3-i22 TaxID=2836373 RepID=UPI001C769751|nr:hypothetical protein [Actinoplanes sp. L3-i22]BCY15455.1 hypothetical protein L3i22_105430 [Actinoplanes sp. L3-i22]
MPELELSYRRLLLAYPRSYRRERGLEILTTLMDAAEPGQTRPSRDEARWLLLAGLRYRFVPPGRIAGLAAALVTLWVALVLGGAGTAAVFAAQRPAAPALGALSDELAGQPAANSSDASGLSPGTMAYRTVVAGGDLQTFGAEGWTGRLPVPDEQSRGYDRVPDVAAVVNAAYQRLQRDGWTMGTLLPGSDNAADGVFWAERDGALIRVAGTYDRTGVNLSWYPVEPPGLLLGAITGFLAGGLLAWSAMTWLTRRIARTAPATRRRLLLLGLPALIACAVNSLDCVASMVPGPGTASVLLGSDLMYPLGNQLANPLAPAIIGLTLFGVLLLLGEAAKVDRLRPLNPAGETARG